MLVCVCQCACCVCVLVCVLVCASVELVSEEESVNEVDGYIMLGVRVVEGSVETDMLSILVSTEDDTATAGEGCM